MDTIKRSAEFDETRQYRYWLQRHWSDNQPAIALIMLNPSRADHQQDDPTLRRCIRLAQQWQYGSLVVVNLFAYCTASPKILRTVSDPIGSANDRYLLRACKSAQHILLAWGNNGTWLDRDRAVLKLLETDRDRCYCLGKNLTGQPRHPLYVPRSARPYPWQCAT